jgi:hypothetical protein
MLRMYSSGRFLVVAALAVASASCGDVVRQGRSPVALVVENLQGATGAGGKAGTYSGTLLSDVVTIVTTGGSCSTTNPCSSVFDDFGQMTLHVVAKDVSISPTSNNSVTITRYHVRYSRADGRNTPGVDVPYEFDGAVTGTVPPSGSIALAFELVRHVAKEEAPLAQLASSAAIINTIAEVTIYGTDQVGNAITASGLMSIEFGNFADPQ